MKLKKQVLNEGETRALKFPKKKEINRICRTADALEVYLQLAYEENKDVEQTMEYMHDAVLATELPLTNVHLRNLAASIYTHAQALQFVEKRVLFSEKGFCVEVYIRATPF